MTKEFQKCQRCGKVFTWIEQTGPSIGSIGEVMRHSSKGACSNCGGVVIWVDENGSPLSAARRLAEAQHHLKLAFLWGIILLIVLFILYFLVMK